MAIRYVGPGGNDGNNGLTWALRKLTLNGVEDTPVAAGDTVYVGPGVYREYWICDVNGAGGNIITYIGDVTGENTDGVGGIVRITGSDDDQSHARGTLVNVNNKEYRTFRGFFLDSASANSGFYDFCNDNVIIEDCYFEINGTATRGCTDSGPTANSTVIIRRCYFVSFSDNARPINIFPGAYTAMTAITIENCVIFGSTNDRLIYATNCGGITVKNSFLFGGLVAVQTGNLFGNGDQLDVYNSLIIGNHNGVQGGVAGDIIENFNAFSGNTTDRINTDVGASSNTYLPILKPQIFFDGIKMPPFTFSELSEWSATRSIAGTAESADDLFGRTRPVTSSKKSWGATQFTDMERETGTVRTGSVSIVLHDAGRHQIWVPVTATSTTIKIYVYREANYAGNLPQMIIKQPGQADDVTTDVGAVGGWNLLTTTLVPAADPPYIVVELVSRNTAVALAYKTFFDDLDVS